MSVRTGLTTWAVAELRHLVGPDAEGAATALASRAPVSLRATGDVQELHDRAQAAGFDLDRGAVEPTCLLLTAGDPARIPGFSEGAFEVQDQASAFVVRALDPTRGASVADVCAAPGGKAIFASELVGTDGLVVAADVHERRLRRALRAERAGIAPLGLVVHDARQPALRPGSFDRVLVDAPCSGIGSARRRPELLWRVREPVLAGLAARQLAIATAAADLLRPGGRLVYSVCTFPRIETDAVADLLLARRPELQPVEVAGPDGAAARHRLWPHRHGTDGMFVAVFERAG